MYFYLIEFNYKLRGVFLAFGVVDGYLGGGGRELD